MEQTGTQNQQQNSQKEKFEAHALHSHSSNMISNSDTQKKQEKDQEEKNQDESKSQKLEEEIPECQIDLNDHCQLFKILESDQIMEKIEKILQKDYYKPTIDDNFPKRSYNLQEDLSIILMMRKRQGYLGYDFTGYGPQFFQSLKKHGFTNRTSQSLRDRYKRNLKALKIVNIERIINWIEKNETLDAFLFFQKSQSGKVFAEISQQDPISIKKDKFFGLPLSSNKYDDDDQQDYEDSEYDEFDDNSESDGRKRKGPNHHSSMANSSSMGGHGGTGGGDGSEIKKVPGKRGRPRQIKPAEGEEKIEGEENNQSAQKPSGPSELRKRRHHGSVTEGQGINNESNQNASNKQSFFFKYGVPRKCVCQELFKMDIGQKKDGLNMFLEKSSAVNEKQFEFKKEENFMVIFNLETKKIMVQNEEIYKKKQLESFFAEQQAQFNLTNDQLIEIMQSITWDFDDFEILLENKNFTSKIRWSKFDDETLKQAQFEDDQEFFQLRQHKGDDRIIKRAQYLNIKVPLQGKAGN